MQVVLSIQLQMKCLDKKINRQNKKPNLPILNVLHVH